MFQEEDPAGVLGVRLQKDVMAVAGESLKINITTLGPLVLPVSEQLLFFAVLVARKVLGIKMKPYIPDFRLAFKHFCIHVRYNEQIRRERGRREAVCGGGGGAGRLCAIPRSALYSSPPLFVFLVSWFIFPLPARRRRGEGPSSTRCKASSR